MSNTQACAPLQTVLRTSATGHFREPACPGDPEERQGFCWHASESDVPEEEIRLLAPLLHEDALLDIDEITLPIEDLRQRFNERYHTSIDSVGFRSFVDILMEVEVRMVNDGKETDTYFIHD